MNTKIIKTFIFLSSICFNITINITLNVASVFENNFTDTINVVDTLDDKQSQLLSKLHFVKDKQENATINTYLESKEIRTLDDKVIDKVGKFDEYGSTILDGVFPTDAMSILISKDLSPLINKENFKIKLFNDTVFNFKVTGYLRGVNRVYFNYDVDYYDRVKFYTNFLQDSYEPMMDVIIGAKQFASIVYSEVKMTYVRLSPEAYENRKTIRDIPLKSKKDSIFPYSGKWEALLNGFILDWKVDPTLTGLDSAVLEVGTNDMRAILELNNKCHPLVYASKETLLMDLNTLKRNKINIQNIDKFNISVNYGLTLTFSLILLFSYVSLMIWTYVKIFINPKYNKLFNSFRIAGLVSIVSLITMILIEQFAFIQLTILLSFNITLILLTVILEALTFLFKNKIKN